MIKVCCPVHIIATKSIKNDNFRSIELKNKGIDVISYQAGPVATKLIPEEMHK